MNDKELNNHTVKNILHFWRDVEIFNLPDFINSDNCSQINLNEPLPWLNGYKSEKKDHTLQYIVVIGKIPKVDVFKSIEQLNPSDKDNISHEELQRIKGNTLLCSFTLNQDGQVTENYLLPTYITGMALLEKNKSLNLINSFLENENNLFVERNNIPQIITIKEENGEEKKILRTGDQLSLTHLKNEIQHIEQLTSFWNKEPIHAYYQIVEIQKNKESDPPFFNSFYLDDLNYLIDTSADSLSPNIQRLLSEKINVNNRVNILTDRKAFLEVINPACLSTGRWPNSLSYNLYHAQLGAVQHILNDLKHEGLFSVNGPPGTGKTTLLKDVIANISVVRAKKIIEIGVDHVFESKTNKVESDGGYTHYYHHLNQALVGEYGIVVSSNNNAAVENISKELPSLEKATTADFEDLDYFKLLSSRLVKDQKNWGVLAAVLGNSTNRSDFQKNFWFDDKINNIPGFFSFLKDQVRKENKNNEPNYKEEFNSIIVAFNKNLRELHQFQNIALQYHQFLSEYPEKYNEWRRKKKHTEQADKELKQIQQLLTSLTYNKKEAEAKIEQYKQNLDLLKTTCPSFICIHKLLNTKAYREWKIRFNDQLNPLLLQQDELRKLESNTQELKLSVDTKKKEFSIYHSNLKSLEKEFNTFHHLKNELLNKYNINKENLPDIAIYSAPLSELHLSMPYFSKYISEIQTLIFLQSLKIHELTIKINEKYFSKNLNYFFNCLTSRFYAETQALQQLWDSFFMCIPVVSTTLASVSRLFPPSLKIGWTLIDEAGQAVPQSAAGLISRSKRNVIVGDPLQIEPVVTIPKSLIEKLRIDNQVNKVWSPYISSIQQLGDRINRLGSTIVNNNDEKIWTGFPLRVHRRCTEPMFSISNVIAYNNQMVLPEDLKRSNTPYELLQTRWIQVEGNTVSNKHIVLEEIEILEKLLQELLAAHPKFNEKIYIISPFKNIADYCLKKFSRKYPFIQCGTVHTFQGKEANTVFVVLGTDKNANGARNWASKTPNILNVAITRAKKNVIIIGNQKLWKGHRYFSDLYAKTHVLNEKIVE